MRRAVVVVAAIAAVAAFTSMVRHSRDLGGYVLVGNLLLEGKDVYLDGPQRINTWPPCFSLLCVPLALLANINIYFVRSVWIIANFAALLFVLRIVGELVHGRRPDFRPSADGLFLGDPVLLVPLALTIRYVASNLSHMQMSLILLVLTLAGLARIDSGRERSGGCFLGLAAALKLMPAAFLPYLVWRGQVRAAAWSAASMAFFTASPVLLWGSARFVDSIRSWRSTLSEGWDVGKMNQSVFAMWDRLVGHGLLPVASEGTNALEPSGAFAATLAYGATLAVALAFSAWTFRSPGALEDRHAKLAEWSAVLIVATIFGPVTWKSYLVVLLLPNALLWAAIVSGKIEPILRRRLAALVFGSFLLGGAASRGIVGKALAWRLDMASVATVSALLMLCAVLMFRRRLASGRLIESESPGGTATG